MDLIIFEILNSLIGQSSTLDWIIIFLAQYLPYILVLATLLFIFIQKHWRRKVFLSITLALSVIISRGLITELIRFFYDRPRPFKALNFEPLFINNDPAFPSGHAAFFFALGIVLFYFNKRWGWWFLGLSLLNGLARVAIGLHWLTDILGGLAVAIFTFLIVQALLPSISKIKIKNPDL